MNYNKRSKGLTALAITNLVLGGLGILLILALIISYAILKNNDQPNLLITQSFWYELITIFIVTLLIIISGLGYFGLWPIGKKLGNFYAISFIILHFIKIVITPDKTLGIFIPLIHPALTLLLLNTIYKNTFYENE